MKNLIAVMAAISFLQFVEANGEEMKLDQAKATILSIEKEIVDLTAVSDLQRSTNFQRLRKSVSVDLGKELVSLIREKQFSVVQSQIALHVLSVLSDERYWEVTEPLLVARTEERVLNDVLLQQLPFGPCYANSIKSEKFRKILETLADEKVSDNTRNRLRLILNGKAADIYLDFLNDPQKYGYAKDQGGAKRR